MVKTQKFDLDTDSTLGGSNASDYIAPSQKAIKDYVDNHSGSNFVTTDTTQNITGEKTFVGDKRIKFQKSSSSDKLGFTLYDENGVEQGGLELRPNTINSKPLLALNSPIGSSGKPDTYLGFRDWYYSKNFVIPSYSDLNSTIKSNTNNYIPFGVTNGTSTVATSSDGTINISTLLSGYQTTSNLVTSVSSSSTDSQYPSAKCVYDALQNAGSSITITYDV